MVNSVIHGVLRRQELVLAQYILLVRLYIPRVGLPQAHCGVPHTSFMRFRLMLLYLHGVFVEALPSAAEHAVR